MPTHFEYSRPARLSFRPWWLWWGLVTVWYTADGLVFAGQLHYIPGAHGQTPPPWGPAVRAALVGSYLWVPLTMLAFWAASRFPFQRGDWLRPLLIHTVGAFFVSVVRGFAVLAFNNVFGWYSKNPPLTEMLVTRGRNVLVYWTIVGIGHVFVYARTVQVQREELAQSQLLVLKSQLQPHFLFNALNTINAYIRRDAGVAEQLIERLSRMLRLSLDTLERNVVPLREELATLEPYLDIERVRFEDRLKLYYDIDDDVLDAAVPHLMLQPLVENAIRHGLSKRASGGSIEISAHREGSSLLLAVLDDGIGARPDVIERRNWRVGLNNTEARLEQLYGAAQKLLIEPRPSGGTAVKLEIPYRSVGT
jgi:two-component sensor histidine kinase